MAARFDLRTCKLIFGQPSFCSNRSASSTMAHPNPRYLMLRRYSQIIQPAPMPLDPAMTLARTWPSNTPTRNKSVRTRSLRRMSLCGSFQGRSKSPLKRLALQRAEARG